MNIWIGLVADDDSLRRARTAQNGIMKTTVQYQHDNKGSYSDIN
jgi:hypothetical protein